jgi:hypothetical protein
MLPLGRSATATIMLATGRADTIAAGAGEVRMERASPNPSAPAAYGQVFDVVRFAGADSAKLARAFERLSDKRVILVPWDYEDMCKPIPWTRGAAWVDVGSPGTFAALHLRPEAYWVNGTPVFDVFYAYEAPYPSGILFRANRSLERNMRTDPELTAAEYFDLLQAMPTYQDAKVQPDSATAMVRRWQSSNPRLAALFPANSLARALLWDTGVRVRKE